MAKADLNLHVGTSYDGQGLQKLDTGIRGVAKQASSAGRTVAQVTSAMASLGQQVDKSAGVISKFAGVFGALAQGGLVGAAVAGVTMLIGKFKEMKEAAKNAAKEAAKAINDILLKSIDELSDKLTTVIKDLDWRQKRSDATYKMIGTYENVEQRKAVAAARSKMIDDLDGLDEGDPAYKAIKGYGELDAEEAGIKAKKFARSTGLEKRLGDIHRQRNKISELKAAEEKAGQVLSSAGPDATSETLEKLRNKLIEITKKREEAEDQLRTMTEDMQIAQAEALAAEEEDAVALKSIADRRKRLDKQLEDQENAQTKKNELEYKKELLEADRTNLIERQQLLDEQYADQMKGLNAEIKRWKDRLEKIAGSGQLSDSAGGGGGGEQHDPEAKMRRRLANLKGRNRLSDKEQDELHSLERMLGVGEWAAVNQKLQAAQAQRDKLAQEQVTATKDIKSALDKIKDNMGI